MIWARWIARILSLVWAGFWVYFGLASGISEPTTERGKLMDVLIHTAVPGLVFLVSALIAWWWQAVGGVLLLVEGLVIAVGYLLMTQHSRFSLLTKSQVDLMLALPPLVSGILFLAASRMAAQSKMGLAP